MKHARSTIAAGLCVALLAGSALSGCCGVLGYGIGAAIDKKAPAVTVQDSVAVGAQYLGKKLTVTTRDKQSIAGTCIGLVRAEDTTYLGRYDQAVAAGLAPPLDAPVTVVTAEARSLDGYLTGFLVAAPPARAGGQRARGRPAWQVCMRAEGAAADTALLLNSVKAIVTEEARVFTVDSLQRNLAAGQIPTGDGLLLVNWRRSISDSVTGEYASVSARDSLVVPLSDVTRLEIWNSRNAKKMLGGLGLMIDVVILAVMVAAPDPAPPKIDLGEYEIP